MMNKTSCLVAILILCTEMVFASISEDLLKACQNSEWQEALKIINNHDVNVNCKDNNGLTPLHYAFDLENTDKNSNHEHRKNFIKTLLKNGAKCDTLIKNKPRSTPFQKLYYSFTMNERKEKLKPYLVLIKDSFNDNPYNATAVIDSNGNTFFFYAAVLYDDPAFAESFLVDDYDINRTNSYGETVYSKAKQEIKNWLTSQKGADTDSDSRKFLSFCKRRMFKEAIELLLCPHKNINVNIGGGSTLDGKIDNYTPLHYTFLESSTDNYGGFQVKNLLPWMEKIGLKENIIYCPIDLRFVLIQELLKKGARLDAQLLNGKKPLDLVLHSDFLSTYLEAIKQSIESHPENATVVLDQHNKTFFDYAKELGIPFLKERLDQLKINLKTLKNKLNQLKQSLNALKDALHITINH